MKNWWAMERVCYSCYTKKCREAAFCLTLYEDDKKKAREECFQTEKEEGYKRESPNEGYKRWNPKQKGKSKLQARIKTSEETQDPLDPEIFKG